MGNPEHRKIIHVDMDAFYASIEQLDDPTLRGKPVAVGGNRERGVVAAASYEARKYGVHSAMPSVRAARLCQNLIFVPPRFARYKEISHQIRKIFARFTSLIEPLALDEAYLDVTHAKQNTDSATAIASSIKTQIREETNLTASAGVSYNKFLAKMASDMDKPDGLFTIRPEEASELIAHLPVKKFHGIGSATAEKMHHAGIFVGADLRKKTEADLVRRFGKSGHYYFQICRGIDHRQVKSAREVKSISAERTFDHDVMLIEEVRDRIRPILEEVYRRYLTAEVAGTTLTLKVKYGDFQQITRSTTQSSTLVTEQDFWGALTPLLTPAILRESGIRLLGICVSNFKQDDDSESVQLVLDF